MQLIGLFIDIVSSPHLYPLWWLFFSWIIWYLFKRRNWPRPGASIMLIYSTSVGIFFIKNLQSFMNCIELCVPYFSLFPFLVDVLFWSVILYLPIALALKPRKLIELKGKWWIRLMVALILLLILSEESVAEIRFLPYIIRNLTYFDLITAEIYFYPVMGIFVPWFVWLLLDALGRPWPALPTMLIYSLSIASVTTRLWARIEMCKIGNFCEVSFSMPLFLLEIALWFIPLYALQKLIVRQEVVLS